MSDELGGRRAPVLPPPSVVRPAPAPVQFRPQRTTRDCAHLRRRAGHQRLPQIHRWSSGSLPSLGMPVAQPIPMLAKPAFGHQARLQRPMTHHRRIRGRGPRRPVRATGPFPPAQMGQTQRGVSAGVHTPGHRTRRRTKDRIPHGRHQHAEPELRTHHRIQAVGQRRIERPGRRLDAHRGLSWSASQPTATNARRASSIFRCA